MHLYWYASMATFPTPTLSLAKEAITAFAGYKPEPSYVLRARGMLHSPFCGTIRFYLGRHNNEAKINDIYTG
jgi:hypothetical protein